VKRFLLWGGGILLILVILVGAGAYAFIHTFYSMPPKADFAKAITLSEAQRQDLEYFRHYIGLNRVYTSAEGEQAATMLAAYEAEAEAGKMTSAQFELAISRMVALSDNGHSEDHPFLFRSHHNNLPCLLDHFSDGYYIVRARPACEALLGAKLVAVDGHTIDEVADRLFDYVRGPRNHYDQYAAPFFLNSPALLNAAGVADKPDRVTLRVQMPDGALRDVPITADPPDPKWLWWVWPDFYLSPLPIAAEGKDWKPLLPPDAKLPTFLEQYNLPFRSENWSGKGMYYFAIRFNVDFFGRSIGKFVDRVEHEIGAAEPRVVIADLRLDKGGNLTATAGLMSHITTLSPAIRHVYVLTGPWTFSEALPAPLLLRRMGATRSRFWASRLATG
jgi:hypothetical protein